MDCRIAGMGNALVDALVVLENDDLLEELGLVRGTMHLVDHDAWQQLVDEVQPSAEAPPIACSTRAAMSTHTLGASAESTAVAANSNRPASNIRTRPRRSAIRPASGSRAAVPTK